MDGGYAGGGGGSAGGGSWGATFDESTNSNTSGFQPVGYFWKGTDGRVYVEGGDGINAAGMWDAQTPTYWSERGFIQTPDSPSAEQDTQRQTSTTTSGGGGGGGTGETAKVLDTAGIKSLDGLIESYRTLLDQAKEEARLKREASRNEKDGEREKEEGKYEGNKLSTLQDFGGALTDTNLGTRDTLENLMSSLSTLGLGGSRALTRQLLNAANKSKREANATQATNTRDLDAAWGEYDAGYNEDIDKIDDQRDYEVGEARRKYYQNVQDATYEKAGLYGDADMTDDRATWMSKGDSYNDNIADSAFLNPRYTGESREMAVPDLADYTQNIAKFDTAGIKGANSSPLTPVSSDGMNAPGNLAVRAIAVNDKDLGIKKKSENDLGYGV